MFAPKLLLLNCKLHRNTGREGEQESEGKGTQEMYREQERGTERDRAAVMGAIIRACVRVGQSQTVRPTFLGMPAVGPTFYVESAHSSNSTLHHNNDI